MARRIPHTPDLSIELKEMWVDAAELKLMLDALDTGDHVDLVSVQFAPKHLRVWQPGERIYIVAYHPADPSPRISSSFWPTTQARRLVSLETMNAAIARALEQPSDQQPARPVPPPIPVPTEPKEDPQRTSIRTYTTPSQPRRSDIADISLSEAVFLVSLLRNNPNQTLGQIAPLSNHQMGLTPYIDADYAVVDILYRRGWITIDPHSPVDAFTWEGNTVTGHYPDAVTWVVSVDHNVLPIVKTDLEERFTARLWPKAWRDELPALWAWVARLECIAYLECSLEDHQLPFHAGEKTHRIIEGSLGLPVMKPIFSGRSYATG